MIKKREHWYLVVLTVFIAVCLTEAFAQSERDVTRAEEIEKRVSGFILPGTRTGAAARGIQCPPDETGDYWLRQSVMHIATQDSADSSEVSRPTRFVFIGFAYSKKTYVPAIGASFHHLGVYIPEAYLPFTLMDTDAGSTGVSYSPLLPLTSALLAEWLAWEVLGARWLQLGFRYILLFPSLALNSNHHLVLMSKGGPMEQSRAQLTVFLGTRWDLWEHARRWTPMAGLQYCVVGPEEGHPGIETGAALCTGIEAPMDLSSDGKAIPGFFVGLKLYFGGGN